ncbi:LamG-like jellyroll fold domain-containing protein [Glycomyces sp. NPDC047369]
MSIEPNIKPAQMPAPEKMRTLMRLPRPRRAWSIAGVGVLTLVLTASLATWPWDRAEVPPAVAQETDGTTDGVADTEADALAEAAASGQPVEVLMHRSELRDVWANPDGTFTANEYAEPVRLLIDGVWADIDPTLQVAADGSISPMVTVSDLRFSAGGAEPLVTIARNDHVMTMDWPGDLPVPTLDGDTAVYAEVLPGVDLWVTALDSGFTHTIVVKSAEAAANSELAAIEWPITVDGAEVETTAEGGLNIVDADTLDAWVATDTPIMWDSTGVAEAVAAASADSESQLGTWDLTDPMVARDAALTIGRQAEVGIAGTGSSIVLTPDQDLLAGVDTVYPVYIDPIYRDESRQAWAMVAEDYPNQEYWKWSDTKNGKGVGTWYDNGPIKRQLFQVPTAAYAGKQILDAEFAVTVTYNWYSDQRKTGYDVYLDTVSGFSKSTNWNNRPTNFTRVSTADAPAATGGACKMPTNGSSTAMEWDIDATMQTAANAGKSSLSFQVRNADENTGSHWIRICNNGVLRVKYNTPPDQPKISNLSTSNGSCRWSIIAGNDSYFNSPTKEDLPTLSAVVTDPDHGDTSGWGSNQGPVSELLKAEFRVYYDGVLKMTYTNPSPVGSGGRIEFNLATSGIAMPAAGTVLTWDVRASDGSAWSKYSSEGNAACRMIYDPTAPDAPMVTSTTFTPGNDLQEVIGELGDLTFDTTATDVVKYRYFINYGDGAEHEVALDTVNEGTTIGFMPTIPGLQSVDVWAFDAAGNPSVHTTFEFRATWSDPVGVWELDDAAGSATVADVSGDNPGTVGDGVALGEPGRGPATAAKFNGTADAYISTADYGLAPTGEGVSIAARVRVDDLSHDGVVASIDGGLGEAGMVLGYRSLTATSGTWVLSMPDMPMNAFTSWEVTAGSVNTSNVGTWVYLVGVWNDATGQMSLYVNGDFANAGTGTRKSAWWGDGTIQIGRAMSAGVWGDYFEGAIADVWVYDRTVPPVEAENYGWQAEVRTGYWQFNTGTTTSPEFKSGVAATLSGDAEINHGEFVYDPDTGEILSRGPDPLVGTGDLVLDGVGDYAAIPSAVVNTAQSFTATARVRFDTAIPAKSMTVLAFPGEDATVVEVGYDASSGHWQLCVAQSDDPATTDVNEATRKCTLSSKTPSALDSQSIAVVYDTYLARAVLYVDGTASAPIDMAGMTPWSSTDGILLGRNADATQYFAGAIDDMRVYTGVLHDSVIARLALGIDVEHPEI